MEKDIIQSRLTELSRDNENLSRLTDLTIYEVSRVVSWKEKSNYGVSFYVLEHFNNKPIERNSNRWLETEPPKNGIMMSQRDAKHTP